MDNADDISAEVAEAGAAATDTVPVNMCLVLGGMDTEGEIFDDVLVLLLHDD